MQNYQLDHIGIAVKSLSEAFKLYSSSFSVSLICEESLEEQGVNIMLIDLGGSRIELLESNRADSTLSKFLEKRGPGLHHVCYRVSNIKDELARLKSSGFKLIDEAPRKGILNSKIAFIHPSSTQGVLTELCEYEHKAN